MCIFVCHFVKGVFLTTHLFSNRIHSKLYLVFFFFFFFFFFLWSGNVRLIAINDVSILLKMGVYIAYKTVKVKFFFPETNKNKIHKILSQSC